MWLLIAAGVVVALIVGVVVLSLAAAQLAGTLPSASATPTSEPAAAGVPSPDAGQAEQLLAALRDIDPALDHERSISRARDTCQTILAGEDRAKVLSMAHARFDGTASISSGDARKIVALIEGSDWCR